MRSLSCFRLLYKYRTIEAVQAVTVFLLSSKKLRSRLDFAHLFPQNKIPKETPPSCMLPERYFMNLKTFYVSDPDGTLMRNDETISAFTVRTVNDMVASGLAFYICHCKIR